MFPYSFLKWSRDYSREKWPPHKPWNMRKGLFFLFSSCHCMRRLFNISLLVVWVSLSQFQFVKKGTNTVIAHFQDDETSRLWILNMAILPPWGWKWTISWGKKNLSIIATSLPKYCIIQIYSISVILKFHGRRDHLEKKCLKRLLRRVIMKQRLRNTILEKTIPPKQHIL